MQVSREHRRSLSLISVPTTPSLMKTLGSDPAGPSPTPFPALTLQHGLSSFLALITNQILLRGWLGSLGGGHDGVELEGCAVRALGSTLAGGGAASRSRQRDVCYHAGSSGTERCYVG